MTSLSRQVVVSLFLINIAASLRAAPLPADLEKIQSRLGVPTDIAQVTDGDLAGNGRIPDIILIQDVHRHPEVQGHIAALVLYGSEHWGLTDIFLEGAQASAPVALPATKDNPSLYDALKKGELSGAEMAAALMPFSPLALHGLEDAELYRQNVVAYDAVQKLREPAMRELQTARLLQFGLDMNTDRHQWPLLERMLQLRLKPAERVQYLEEPYQSAGTSVLSRAIQAANDFYALADHRSDVFVKTVEGLPQFGAKLVVVGGYHTIAMAQELRRQGKSFAVLTPHVTQSGYDGLYVRGMQETVSALKIR